MNSPFAWPGGKNALRKTLISLLPEHSLYVEVFAGSAKLLFAKTPAKVEVLNDLNADLITFFRVAKHRSAELAERLEQECIHAGRFRELRDAATPTDEIDQALRFAYLCWYSFGAKGTSFASITPAALRIRRSLDSVRELLHAVADRLAAVLIEQRDFAQVLARYDSAETFFYLDPPYVSYKSNDRYAPLTSERRLELFASLAALKGRFLLSFDDHPEVRGLARQHGFHVRRVDVVYTLSGKGPRRPRPELLIANYELPRTAR